MKARYDFSEKEKRPNRIIVETERFDALVYAVRAERPDEVVVIIKSLDGGGGGSVTAERREVEEALVRWADVQGGWRVEYYFDCGELGIVRLFILVHHDARYWKCRWLSVEPCPALADELVPPEGVEGD